MFEVFGVGDLLDHQSFHPILIKDVVTISKEELMAMKGEFFTDEKMVTVDTEVSANVTYKTTLELCAGEKGDELYVGIQLTCDKGISYGGNTYIRVKYANHSVKYKQWPRFKGSQTWSEVLCALTDVLNPEKNFLVDEMLTLRVEAVIFDEPNDYEFKGRTLAQDLWERDDRDFVISVGKEYEQKTAIKVHKIVLATRSLVFDRMLETDMKEKSQNRLEIIDFDAEVVQAAVEYCYHRDNFKEMNIAHLIDLLHFVDKYQIVRAKDKIQSIFLLHIYPDTMCQIANASITSYSAALKEACIKTLNLYIRENVPFEDVDSLDKDFCAELLRSLSKPEEEDSSTDDDVSVSDF